MSKAAELANLIGNINAGGGGVNRNVIINGAMNVAQRGTSETGVGGSNGYFTVDRWQFANVDTDGRYTVTQDSSAPAGFANSTKLDCTTADTSVASTELIKFRQKIEGQNLQGFAKGTSDAKPFAVSFYVKGNASATYACELLDQDNDRQITKLFSVTTDWTRVELTFPADTTGTFDDDNAQSMQIQFVLHSGSAYTSGTLNSDAWAATSATERYGGISSFVDSTDRTFFITGIQMEVGQNPTTFEHEPFDVTLQKCHRYFFKNSSTQIPSVVLRPDNIRNFDIGFPTMRASATATVGYNDDSTGVSIAAQSVSADRYRANTAATSSSSNDPRLTSFEVDAEL
jgi:hypothetical protein